MPAPAMPITMRGDGRGTKLKPRAAPIRHFAGKGEDQPEEDDDETDEEVEEDDTPADESVEKDMSLAQSKSLALPSIDIQNVDLQQHYQRERINESRRLEAEQAAEQSASEYETDDASGTGSEEEEEEEEEDEAPRRVLPKPTFISKSQRAAAVPTIQTNGTKAVKMSEKSDLDEQQKRRLEARELLQHQIRAETQTAAAAAEPALDDVDDTDDVSDESAFQAWKLRELQRLKRDRDALEAREREREVLEARAAVPESIRIAEAEQQRQDKIAQKRAEREERGGAAAGGRPQNRGGFYQDDPVVKRRLEGTLENTGAGQGLRGKFKKEGLLSQDTSRDSLWQQDRGSHGSHGKRERDGMGEREENHERKRRV